LLIQVSAALFRHSWMQLWTWNSKLLKVCGENSGEARMLTMVMNVKRRSIYPSMFIFFNIMYIKDI